MAKSKYDYVRQFESDDRCLPNVWMVARIDGSNFHEFSKRHNFAKPNDLRSLGLMNAAARAVLDEFKSIFIAYGQSDEYSFVFRKDATVSSRRSSKLLSLVVSIFTSNYVFQWQKFFPDQELLYPPSFDSRIVLYPTEKNLRDYLAWRQVDCHINNLYNTTFWSLVLQGEMTNQAATERLSGTLSSDKNEILFSQFGINYNDLPQIFRKGTVLYKTKVVSESTSDTKIAESGVDCPNESGRPSNEGDVGNSSSSDPAQNNRIPKISKKQTEKAVVYDVVETNCDIISDPFWETACPLIEFGCSERPLPARKIPIDKLKDFANW